MFNNRTVISGLHHVTAEEPGLLGCYLVWLGNWLLKFQRNLPPSSSGLGVNSQAHNHADEGSASLQNVGKLIKWCSNQENLLPQYENRFVSVFVLSFPVGTVGTFLHHWP